MLATPGRGIARAEPGQRKLRTTDWRKRSRSHRQGLGRKRDASGALHSAVDLWYSAPSAPRVDGHPAAAEDEQEGKMRHPKDISRRQFLTRAGGAAIAMPSLAAILAACSKPGTASSGGSNSALDNIPIATLDNPVELPTVQDPIPTDTPIESGPLVLYNWADYIYKKVVGDFEDKFGVDVQITTFNNLEEGIQKVVNG